MFKTTVRIDGMSCGMCESHINDVIRSNFKVKKVSSSHTRGVTEIISEVAPGSEELHEAIDPTGYTVLDVKSEPYEKKGFSLFKH